MKKPLACGLYSVHNWIDKDAFSAVRAAAAVGFEALEFYGSAMLDRDFVLSALRDTGLKIAGWHVSVDLLASGKRKETLDFHSAIGNKAIIVPWLPDEMRATRDDWMRTAEFFNALLPDVEARGMTLGYHNHEFEFKPLDDSGVTGWDLFSDNTDKSIVLQIDGGNALAGGADPVKLLRAHPGRSKTLHLKPYSHKTGYAAKVGQDDFPWTDFLSEAEHQGETQWYIVEYETDSQEAEIDGLRSMREALREYGL